MKYGEFKDGQNVVLKTSASVLLDIVPFNDFPFPGCEGCICHPSGLSCAGLLDANMRQIRGKMRGRKVTSANAWTLTPSSIRCKLHACVKIAYHQQHGQVSISISTQFLNNRNSQIAPWSLCWLKLFFQPRSVSITTNFVSAEFSCSHPHICEEKNFLWRQNVAFTTGTPSFQKQHSASFQFLLFWASTVIELVRRIMCCFSAPQ